MVCIVPAASTTEPIDWCLRATDLGEICTPFAHYVRPEPTCCSRAAFPAFARLPTELQIHVLRFCSSATLFQLMRTSAMLRHEASKLFWSDPDAWYNVDGSWLLAGGFPGDTYYAANFLRQIQQVEVSFEDIRNLMASDDSIDTEPVEEPSGRQEKRIRDFWSLVQCRFPKVARVVVSENTPRKSRKISLKSVARVLQGCPNSVNVFASVIDNGDGTTNRATRYRARFSNVNSRWEVTELEWVRKSILIPPKTWRGPVGELAQARYQFHRHMRMTYGTDLLLIKAVERSHFGGQARSFRCPGLRCEALIERSGLWATHAVETGHYIYAEAPESYKEAFAQREDMINSGFKAKVYGVIGGLHEQYRMAERQQQEEIRQAFLDQLENDAQYAVSKPVQESVVWKLYLDRVCGEAYSSV